MDHRSRTALFQALEHDAVDVIQRLRDELAFTKAWIPLHYRDLQLGQFLHFNRDNERESALEDFVHDTAFCVGVACARSVCNAAGDVCGYDDNPYLDNTGYRQARKTQHIKEHIEKTYLVDLDDFMVRFEGYDADFNLRLKLPFLHEDGTP